VAAAIVFAIGAIAGRRAPRAVALLWLVVLMKPLLTLAGVSLLPMRPPASIVALQPRVETQAEVTKRVTRTGPVVTERHAAAQTRSPAGPIAAIWMAGAALVLARTIHDRLRLREIVAKTQAASPRVASAYARLAGHRAQPPRLRVSEALDGPAIGGIFRPVILIPAWMDAGADEAQLDWTLRHELRHATARDTFAIALRELSLIALWFHPLIWVAAQRWEAATELACDRDVVSSDAEAVDYADALYRTLLNVRQQRRLQLASGLFATRSKIGTRVAALVERPLAPKAGRPVLAVAAAIAIAVIAFGADLSARSGGHHRGNYEEVIDGRTTSLRYEGTMKFSRFSGRIESLDGFIEMRETREGRTRELRLDGTAHGITRTYRIDGRPLPPDDAFERVMTSELRRVMNR